MRLKKAWRSGWIAVSFGIAMVSVSAQTASDQSAARRISAALDALGGKERIEALSAIVIKTSGREHRSAEEQGYDPERETDTAHEETIVAFPGKDRFLYEHKTGRHDGTTRWRRWSYIGDERTVIDFVDRFASVRRMETAPRERIRRSRRIPHLLLLEAENNAAGLSLLPRAQYQGRAHDVILFPLSGEKTPLKLFLDTETHLLTKYEYLMDLPSRGDVTVEQVYGAYRKHEKLGLVPASDRFLVAGKVWRAVAYAEVQVDSSAAASLFELPDDLRQQLAAPGSVSQLAPGVFLVNSLGSLSPLFIEFKDFVLAVEAPIAAYSLDAVPADTQPGSSSVSEQFIRMIKERIPGKPIRYFVATHSHSDHAGGARAFVAEGATILMTTGNRQFFERMVSAQHQLVPDRLAREPRPLRFETFSDKRVVTDGERRVELINVGANPHTAESIVVHLPVEKIIYQGDLFYFDGEATFPPRNRSTVMPFFARWLIDNKLAPDRIYGAHDRGYATMEHVRRVLKANLSARQE